MSQEMSQTRRRSWLIRHLPKLRYQLLPSSMTNEMHTKAGATQLRQKYRDKDCDIRHAEYGRYPLLEASQRQVLAASLALTQRLPLSAPITRDRELRLHGANHRVLGRIEL